VTDPRPLVLVAPDPRHLVCVGAGGSRTAAVLCGDVVRVQEALTAGPGEEVLVRCEGRYAFAVAVLACWARGAVVRLPPDLAAETLAGLASTARDVLHDGQEGTLDLRPLIGGPPGMVAVLCPPEAQEVVRLSTSGSTGEVRTVPKTAGQLIGEARVLASTFGLRFEVVLATVPSRHIYGLLFGVLVPLCAGGAFVEETPFFGEAIGGRIREHGVTVLVTVPAHLRLLTEVPSTALGLLRRVFSSGAPLAEETARALRAGSGLDATEVFGSTETGGIAWRQQLQDPRWLPLPGVEIDAEEGGRLVLNASPFLPPDAPRPWRADDRIELGGGRFLHLGRLDDVVKIGGRRVSLGAVNRRVLDVVGVTDGVVLAVERGDRTVLEALVVTEGLDAAALRLALRDQLDGVAMPRFTVVERLPRTENGKLPRAAVLAVLDAARAGRPTLDQPGLIWTRWRGEATRAEGEVRLLEDAPWLRGHFPEAPVLPGVAQLHALVVGPTRVAWPGLGAVLTLPRVRFLQPVVPGDALRVVLEREAGWVRFEITRDQERCAGGVVVFEVGEDA
jgi:acyl-coenzyme A synthetase/AMP-(fatty) acid ligase/3-hydroxymyristoyl/3-hydroxydecanoyl-(acyl carrier protein) dehydratase